MPHFRVDDALHSHPKAQRVGDDALGFWVRAGSYCMAYLTDGFVPEWWVKQQPKGVQKAQKLVAGGLWISGVERDGERGYQFHEFVGPGRQDSREKIEADRELARKRKEKSRRESRRDSPSDEQRDTPRDGQGESRRTPGYTQPNPTHKEEIYSPLEESSLNVGGPRDDGDPTAERGLSAAIAPTASRLVATLIPNTIPAAVRTSLRVHASQLMRGEGVDSDVMADALRRWLTKPDAGPGLLPSLVADVIRTRTTDATGATHNGRPKHKMRTLVEQAADMRAREQAQLATASRGELE